MEEEVKIDQIWRHMGNGRFYRVKAVANTTAERPEWVPTVVYEGVEGAGQDVYARPLERFLERMERIR